MFLEKYKHVVRKKKMPYFITDDTEIYSDDSDGSDDSDESSEMKNITCINLFFKRKSEKYQNFF